MGKNRGKKFNSISNTRNTSDAIKLKTEEITDDLFSCLPEDILCFIISFLPFKSAVKTSFLSTQWRDLWKKWLQRNGTVEDAVGAISQFLIDFDEIYRSRNIWGFQFNFHNGDILFASLSPNNKLHLDFSVGKQEYSKEFGWLLEQNRKKIFHQPRTFCTFVVKTLYLISVSYHTSQPVSSLVSNFPLLEDLTIAKCKGLRSLDLFANTRLRQLTILDCPQLKFLGIEASRLHSFRYRGQVPWFCLDHNLHLKHAMLDFRKGPGYCFMKTDDFASILYGIKYAKTLTLCRWTFERLIRPFLSRNEYPVYGNLKFYKLEELWWIDYEKDEKYDHDVLISFLKRCPFIETLSVTIDSQNNNVPSVDICSAEVTEDTRLYNLNVVKLIGFRNHDDEIILAKKLKEVLSVEPRFVASSDGKCWRNLVRESEVQGEEFSCKFVEERRHINWLCPKHPHMSL